MTQDNSLEIVRQNEVGGVILYQVYTQIAKFETIKKLNSIL